MTEEEQQAVATWQADSEHRARGRRRPAKRGGTNRSRAVVEGAWRCEGRWQVPDQMDIWACIDEAELDERRKRGEIADDAVKD